MKKLALLIAVIMSLLTFSFVLATEGEDVLLIAPAPEATEENAEEGIVTITSEDEVAETEPTEGNGEVVDTANNEEVTTEDGTTPVVISTDDTETTKSNSTIIGAIIAIVIVVVVVALAALVQKK